MNARAGARPWLAYTQYDYAAMLLEPAAAGDRRKARSLVESALETAEALGMRPLAEKSRALREAAERGSLGRGQLVPDFPPVEDAGEPGRPAQISGHADTVRVDTPPALAPTNVFRREGEYWTIVYGDTSIRVRDTKGLQYIAHLLAHPGREMHVADLTTLTFVSDEGIVGHGPRPSKGDLGAILDPTATAAYKRRLAELREELEKAEAAGDSGNAARARHEVELALM